jgi:Zn-finger nucleic acid-binding protein
MLCPTCKTPLSIADRQGIEIDFCPTCRGVWLDRGELDKFIERSSAAAPAGYAPGGPAVQPPAYAPTGHAAPPSTYGYRRRDDDDDDDDWDDDDRRRYARPGYGQPGYDPRYNQHGYPRRKRESWLSDLFDFD